MRLLYRRNLPLIVLLVSTIAVITLTLGNYRVIAYTSGDSTVEISSTPEETRCISGSVDLFDKRVVHSVRVSIPVEELEKMANTFQQTGEKDYFTADVEIDGTSIQSVGIRLKGNASLRNVLGRGKGGGGMGGMQGGAKQNPGAQNPVDQNQNTTEQNTLEADENAVRQPYNQMPIRGLGDGQFQQRQDPGFQANGQIPDGQPDNRSFMPGQAGGEAGQMPQNGLQRMPPANDANPNMEQNQNQTTSIDLTQVNIPFKIRFDKYVTGQCYQGLEEINIRTSGTGTDAAILQEPLTNAMARLVGLDAPRTVFTGFSMNDGSERLLVISELVDSDYLERIMEHPEGILYKAEMGSSLTYNGEALSSYSNSFSQETRKNEADYKPLIAFSKFLTEADEKEFEEKLTDWLDVDSFALYLAVENLLVNRDSMADMNNNYYLYYDNVEEKFTVLMWDANESLGKLGGGSQGANYDLYYSRNTQTGRIHGGGKNILIQRFFANEHFKGVYEAKLVEAYRKIFLSGAVFDQVNEYSEVLHAEAQARGLTDLEKFDAAVEKDISFLNQRFEFLMTTALLVDKK